MFAVCHIGEPGGRCSATVGSLYTVRVIVAPRDGAEFGAFVAFVSNAAASGGEQNK